MFTATSQLMADWYVSRGYSTDSLYEDNQQVYYRHVDYSKSWHSQGSQGYTWEIRTNVDTGEQVLELDPFPQDTPPSANTVVYRSETIFPQGGGRVVREWWDKDYGVRLL